MGYLFLSLALIAGATKGYCGKKMGNAAVNVGSAVLLNLFRMLLCIPLCLLLISFEGNISAIAPTAEILSVSAISGVSTAVFVASWLLAVRKSAYMMVDVFLTLGTLVPVISGYFLFSEAIGTARWIGFFILLAAVIIMCSYNNSIKVKLTPASLIMLIAAGLANGVTSVSQKLFIKGSPGLPVSVFNLYTYIFAALTLFVFFLLFRIREKPIFDKEATKRPFLYVFIMALMLASHSYFTTLAAGHLDSAVLYPMSQGISLVLATLMATFFFGEKFKLKAGVGIALAFAALMLINL